MADPRLNSIHLRGTGRLDGYRQARQQVFEACGLQTLAPAAFGPAADPDARTFVGEVKDEPPAAGPPPSGFWLVDRDTVYPLKVGLNTVGRMPDNDVAILDAGVSRRHCVIVVHVSSGCEVHDVASKNGTFVNGRRIAGRVTLAAGDEVRLCDRHLTFLRDERGNPMPRGPAGPITETDVTARIP